MGIDFGHRSGGTGITLSSTLVESLQQENAQLSARVADLSEQLDGVRRQLEWFKRQFFGRTSERRREFDDVAQASLFEALGLEVAPGAEAPTEQDPLRTAQEVSRRRAQRAGIALRRLGAGGDHRHCRRDGGGDTGGRTRSGRREGDPPPGSGAGQLQGDFAMYAR